MERNIRRELMIICGIIVFFVGFVGTCIARGDGVPLVVQLEPLDTSAPELYIEKQTAAHDPALQPGQVRVTVSSVPVWYADETTRELKRVAIDLQPAVDAERQEIGYSAGANTIRFLINAGGETVYSLAGYKLRMWLSEQGSDAATELVSAKPVDAIRPSRMTVEAKELISLDGILPGVRIEHSIEPGRVKEYLTIATAPETKDQAAIRYVWRYESNLNPVINGAGIDWRDGDRTVFQSPGPQAWDAKGTALHAFYELALSQIAIVLDAAAMGSAVYPVTIDPTVTTVQSDATANRSIGDATGPDRNHAFAKITLPDLTGLFSSIDSATFKATTLSGAGTVAADVRCDVVGAWDETSLAATLAALSFNAVTASAVSISITPSVTTNFTVLGAIGTNGIRKIYTDDPSPSPATVKLSWTAGNATNDYEATEFWLGMISGTKARFYDRTDATYYWRLEIVYTAAGGGASAKGSGSVGMING